MTANSVTPDAVILTWLTRLFLGLILGILLVLSSGCASIAGSGRAKLKELKLAPLSEMPDYVQNAPPEVQGAYQFAIANPDLLRNIPCHCGCNSLGHMNNTDCYVKSFRGNDTVAEFDNHAAY